MEAYILVTTSSGKVREAFEGIKKLEGVREVQVVTGSYDIITLVEAENTSGLRNVLEEKIQRVEGIIDTNTSIIVKGRKEDSGSTDPRKGTEGFDGI